MASDEHGSPGGAPPPFEAEGPESEWKERLPRPERIARTMSAFANGVGGKIWVGVRDDGAVIGVADAAETAGELRRIASDLVAPSPALRVKTVRFARVALVVAEVGASEVRPVLAPGRDGRLAPFVRDGSSTRPRAARDPAGLVERCISGLARRARTPAPARDPSPCAGRNLGAGPQGARPGIAGGAARGASGARPAPGFRSRGGANRGALRAHARGALASPTSLIGLDLRPMPSARGSGRAESLGRVTMVPRFVSLELHH